MEDLRRLIQENAACKAKIEGLEADLEQLMRERVSMTETSEVLSNAGSALDLSQLIPTIDGSIDFDDENEEDTTSRRAAKRRKALCASQLENARLKNVIAEKEAANASLLVQLNDLKSKLARAQEATAAGDNQIERLRRENSILATELDKTQQIVSSQKEMLKQIRAQAKELTIKHQDALALEEQNQTLRVELEELQRKIKQIQLTSEAKITTIQSENRRVLQKLEESSAKVKHNNEALKSEIEALRVQNEKLSQGLSFEKSKSIEFRVQQEQEVQRYISEVQRLQQWKNSQTKAMTRVMNKILPRLIAKVMNAIDRTDSAIAGRLDNLEVQIGSLIVTAQRLQLLKPPDDGNDGVECEDFLAQFARGIKSIEKLSQAYASSRPLRLE
jgi:myosin heavy subunit